MIAAGTYIATRPRYTSTVVVTGTTYYYWGGVYYISQGTQYVVVVPPPGAVVYAVPAPTTVVYANTQPYYYINGTYYVASDKPAQLPKENPESKEKATDASKDPKMTEAEDHSYEVVGPPPGATVPYLPEKAKKKEIGGKSYFVYNDTYYRAFASDGDTVYMVVADPTKPQPKGEEPKHELPPKT